jgi:hypothetical protein
MLTLAVVGGFAVAAVRVVAAGGRTSRLLRIEPVRWWQVAAACFALQLFLTLGPGWAWDARLRTGLILATHVVVVVVAAVNVRRPWRAGMAIALAGLLLNLAVMVANGGLMPVSPQTLARPGNGYVLQRLSVGQPLPHSKDVILAPEQTRLALLSDWLTVPWRRGSFSPGDVLIAVGAFVVLQAAVSKEHGRKIS